MTEMYEDKGDDSCFLKDSSREGLNFIVLVQEESFLYCEHRRLNIQHELGTWKIACHLKGERTLMGAYENGFSTLTEQL